MNNGNNYLGRVWSRNIKINISLFIDNFSDHLTHLLFNIERTVGELCQEEVGEAAVVLGDDQHQHLAGRDHL